MSNKGDLTHCISGQNALDSCVSHFLAMSIRWSPRWMNKPKFHMLTHLKSDVPRFGPPILYATEGFESFNTVIRDWSIHSNRQAPSRDIGVQAAEAACIRHLMSGGYFIHKSIQDDGTIRPIMCQIGLGPRALMDEKSIVRKRLGLERELRKPTGECCQRCFGQAADLTSGNRSRICQVSRGSDTVCEYSISSSRSSGTGCNDRVSENAPNHSQEWRHCSSWPFHHQSDSRKDASTTSRPA